MSGGGRFYWALFSYKKGLGEVSEWFMVPLSKSGLAFGERGFESHPLRFLHPGL